MDTTTLSEEGTQAEFLPGAPVIYAMHGKCNVLGTETRQMGDKSIRFYKLEIKKSALSRSNRQEPAIWVPVSTAKERGLRAPMNRIEAESAMKLLMSREYFFSTQEPWNLILPKLESTILNEGGLGLAKVSSYLHVLKRRQVVPASEILKLHETVHKLLLRELSEAFEEPIRNLEEKIARGFRSKLLPDS
jgi:RNA polymerase-interacting CarD/CdnL/TRCF family regulator